MYNKLVSVCTLSARKWPINYMATALSKQTYPNLEWVLVDFSYESNKDTIADWNKQGLRIKHVRPCPVGLYMKDIAQNRNAAIKNAAGDFIIFLDDYSLIPHNFVANHMAILNSYIVSCGLMWAQAESPRDTMLRIMCVMGELTYEQAFIRLQENKDVIPDSRWELLNKPQDPTACLGPEWTYTGNLGISRKVLEATGGFDPRLSSRGEDGDFGIRADMLGAQIYFNPWAACINFTTKGLGFCLDFDHTHDLPFLHKNDLQIKTNTAYQKALNVRVEQRYGVDAAICKICGAEYLLNPADFIYAKKARGEYKVPAELTGF